MPSYRYLIVGGGLTADGACKGIRERDSDGTIGLVSEEPHPPYSRPPLSKSLWQGGDEEKIWRGTETLGVDVRLGRSITSVDLDAHTATDGGGEVYEYERLLFATGGRPRRLPFGGEDVVYFRTLDDYRRLRSLAGEGRRFVVIGGGFIGTEIAAALRSAGSDVSMLLRGETICENLFPPDLAAYVTDYYRAQGVEVLVDDAAEGIERTNGTLRVETESGRAIEADGVVAGIGIEPRTNLAAAAGLPVDNGIVVDELGRVEGREDVFAAGDVARFPLTAIGRSARVEHEDHAISHGRAVGANMTGAGEPYEHLPFFYSDLFDLGYEAVGEISSRHETVADWKEPNREGVVYYLGDDRRVRGVLLWNVWGKVDAARELIHSVEPFDSLERIG